MRARKSCNEWSKIIQSFERSGESHEEFCSRQGLNLGSFRGWLYRLRKAAAAAPEVALLPVTLTGVTSWPRLPVGAPGGEIVVMVSDVQVRLLPGTDTGYVAALVMELRARC
jgi:hypothetical protein